MYNKGGLHATFLKNAFCSFSPLLAFGHSYLYIFVKFILRRMRYVSLTYCTLHLLSTFHLQTLNGFIKTWMWSCGCPFGNLIETSVRVGLVLLVPSLHWTSNLENAAWKYLNPNLMHLPQNMVRLYCVSVFL